MIKFKSMRFQLLIIVLTLFCSNAVGQKSSTVKCEFDFGSMTEGEITLIQLLSDSLRFHCADSSYNFVIGGFGLTTKCDGVTRYFKNEKDGSLTPEMKANVRTLKPGCLIEFSNVYPRPLNTRRSYGYYSTKERLKFWLK